MMAIGSSLLARNVAQRTSALGAPAPMGLVCGARSLRLLAPRRRRGGGDGGCSSDAPGAIQGPVPVNFPTFNFGTSGAPALPSMSEEGASHGGTMRTIKPVDSEEFFFRGQKSLVGSTDGGNVPSQEGSSGRSSSSFHRAPDPTSFFCRLCQEDVVPPFTPRSHILASARSSHLNHSCRETVLDTLTLLLARGYPVDNIVSVWAHVLYDHPSAFPRIKRLSSPDAPLRERGEHLLTLLQLLAKWGVIDIAFAIVAPDTTVLEQQTFAHRRRVSMERTECIGDNSWGHHMSHRMIALFPDRQYLHSQFSFSYNSFRDACEMNVTLEWMYDVLQIAQLFPVHLREKVGNGKMKADIVEAILGELHLNLFGFMPSIYDNQQYVEPNGCGERLMSSLIEHVMTEMFDMIILHFVEELSITAIPLAKELAAPMLWRTARAQLHKQKDRTGSLKRRNQAIAAGRVVHLPPVPLLQAFPVQRPLEAPHPLRTPAFTMVETTMSHNGSDVFEAFVPQFRNLSDKFVDSGVVEAVRDECVAWQAMRDTLRLGLADDAPVLDLDVEELYFRDAYYDLSMHKPTAPMQQHATIITKPSTAAAVLPNQPTPLWSQLQRSIYPPIQAAPDQAAVVSDGCGPGAKDGSARVCYFSMSRFVPHGVKPPSAGVITDKNLCFGQFLLFASDMDQMMDAWRARCSVESAYFPRLLQGLSSVKVSSSGPSQVLVPSPGMDSGGASSDAAGEEAEDDDAMDGDSNPVAAVGAPPDDYESATPDVG